MVYGTNLCKPLIFTIRSKRTLSMSVCKVISSLANRVSLLDDQKCKWQLFLYSLIIKCFFLEWVMMAKWIRRRLLNSMTAISVRRYIEVINTFIRQKTFRSYNWCLGSLLYFGYYFFAQALSLWRQTKSSKRGLQKNK